MSSKSESIKVVCRIRPFNQREKDLYQKSLEDNPDYEEDQAVPFFIDGKWPGFENEPCIGKSISCYTEFPRTERSLHQYNFDSVQWMVDQDSCFEYVGLPTCKKFLEGINGTIFAYGQTGSGKSYSMFGKEPQMRDKQGKLLPLKDIKPPPVHQQGLIPRCVSYTYSWLIKNQNSIKTQQVTVSFYEIYINDLLRDLLDNGRHMQKYEDPYKGVVLFDKKVDKKKFFAEERRVKEAGKHAVNKYLLRKVPCHSLEDVLRQFAIAQQSRTVKATPMNPFSSRGHGVLTFELFFELKNGGKRHAKLSFADLAGSETVKKTAATKDILAEAQAINYSLSVLGRVITALATQKMEPPFRDSSLSHCLKDSLAGNCRTTLVVCCSPHENNLTESLSSLNFAKRCKMIKTKTFKPNLMSPKEMRKEIIRLKKIIDQLKEGKGTGMGGPSGPCVSVLFFHDFDESKREEIQKKWQELVDKEMMKLQEDVEYVVEVDGDVNDRERVTVTFIQNEHWTFDECRRVRDDLHNLLANSEAFQGEMEKTDPITPEMIARLQDENKQAKLQNEQLKAEMLKLREENIAFQDQIHQKEVVIEKQAEEITNLSRDLIVGGVGDMSKTLRKSTLRKSQIMDPEELEKIQQEESEEEMPEGREALHTYLVDRSEIIILEGMTILNSNEKKPDLIRKALKKHNDQLARIKEVNNDYYKQVTDLEAQLSNTINNYNQLQDSYSRQEERIEGLEKELEERPEKQETVQSPRGLTPQQEEEKADYLWTMLRDKVLVKVFDNPRTQHFQLRAMVHQLMEQREYLQNQDQKYLGSEPDLLLSDQYGFDDDIDDDTEIEDWHEEEDVDVLQKMKFWDAYEVAAWVRQLHNGAFAKYAPAMFKDRLDGSQLVNITEQKLLNSYGFTGEHAEALVEAVDNYGTTNSSDPFEDMKRLLSEFTESDIRNMGKLQQMDPQDLTIRGESDRAFDMTFHQFMETFSNVPKTILIKVFSCLEDPSNNLVSIAALKRFMKVAMQQDPDKRVMLNVSPFVNHEVVFDQFGETNLSVDGAKMVIAKVRGCVPEQIREKDIGVEYMKDLTREDLSNLFFSCPRTAWSHVGSFDQFEKMYCEMEHIVELRNGKDDKVSFDEFMAGLKTCGVKATVQDVELALATVGINWCEDFSYNRALHLLRHPMSDTDQFSLRKVMKDKCASPMELGKAKDRQRQRSVFMQPSNNNVPANQFYQQNNMLEPTVLIKDPHIIQEVRRKLTLFSIFGSTNTLGFDGPAKAEFTTSSSLGTDWTCRLNDTRAGGRSAWCADPEKPAKDGTHYIVADFGQPRMLYAVAMQGHSHQQEFVKQAHIFFSEDGQKWTVARSPTKKLVTLSNHDASGVMIEPLSKPERCRYVRLMVVKWSKAPSLRWDCLVFEPRKY